MISICRKLLFAYSSPATANVACSFPSALLSRNALPEAPRALPLLREQRLRQAR